MTDRFGGATADVAPPAQMRWFVLLWAGQLVSLVSSGMTCFAQSIYTYTNLGATITHLGILVALSQLPGVLIAPLAGLVADRYSRRWVMFICNGIAACFTLVLRSLVVGGTIEIWHMYVLVTIIATANAFQWPAYFATVPMMVPFKHLGRANGMVQSARTLSQLGAPAIAAWLVSTIRLEGIVLFDSISYLIAASILLYVPIPPPPRRDGIASAKQGLAHEAFLGWRYLAARPGLTGLMGLVSVTNFLFAASIVVILPLSLAIADVQRYGVLATACGISSVLGGLAISVWGGPRKRIYGVFGALLLVALGYACSGARATVLLVFAGYTVVSFAMPFVNAISGYIWQSKVPISMQGRVMAAAGMVATFAFQLGFFVTGLAADRYFVDLMAPGSFVSSILTPLFGSGKAAGLSFMFLVFGALQLLFVAATALYPRVRRLDDELPDAVIAHAEAEAEKQAAGSAWTQIDLTTA